ncbi:MAG: hypothetical protein O7C75_04010 [Verrucomicrobia bacterium]|nr:hypothetical protein [Verrucomicrobiota bacterium]
MNPNHFDFPVLGGGSAGYAAARTAHEAVDQLAIVDGSNDLGIVRSGRLHAIENAHLLDRSFTPCETESAFSPVPFPALFLFLPWSNR